MSKKLFKNDDIQELCECCEGITIEGQPSITNSIFNKKFPVESKQEAKERYEKQRVIEEERNNLCLNLNRDYEIKKAIQTAKAFKEYLNKFVYIRNLDFYGKITNIYMEDNGTISRVSCLGFNVNPTIYNNTYLSDMLLRNYNISPCYDDADMQFVSEETFRHEFEKHKKKLIDFVDRHADEELFDESYRCSYDIGVFAKEIQYLVEDDTLTEEELIKRVTGKYEDYLKKSENRECYYNNSKNKFTLDD